MSYFDEYDYDYDYDPSDIDVVCNRCGKKRCYWQPVTTPDGKSERFVLFDGNARRHVCKNVASADEFEPV